MTESRKRVLVVEDDDDLRGLVARVLADNGFDVEQAGDGGEAIEKLHARPADLVILDLMLPGLDGWDVLRHLKKLPTAPPVVMLSVQTEYEVYLRAAREGVAAYVEKPFSVMALLATCREIIHSGRRALASRDRRDSPRRLFRAPAELLFDQKGWRGKGELMDLSLHGARVCVDTPLPFREGLRVAFDVPGAPDFSLEGSVRWRVPMARGFCYGVAFVNVAPEAERRISDALRPA